ncbi:MAG: TrmH family RNA methyltransferase [Caldilineaceae bacterium]
MPTQTIPVTSKNNWYQRAEVIRRNRKKRWEHRQFLVEGVRAINQLRHNPRWQVEALLYNPGQRLSGWAQDVLNTVVCPYHLELTADLLAELSDKEEPSEVLAIVKMPAIDDLLPKVAEKSIVVLLDRPSNPGNLGSIIRSCDAFGVDHVVISGHAADPFDPVTVRATAGAFFHVPLARLSSNESLADWFADCRQSVSNLQIIGTSAQGDLPLTACDFTGPTILCMGNETVGLSAWLKEQCDALAYLHMQGVATSLNLACATTAILFEIGRQRGKA